VCISALRVLTKNCESERYRRDEPEKLLFNIPRSYYVQSLRSVLAVIRLVEGSITLFAVRGNGARLLSFGYGAPRRLLLNGQMMPPISKALVICSRFTHVARWRARAVIHVSGGRLALASHRRSSLKAINCNRNSTSTSPNALNLKIEAKSFSCI
jgi:hypothetical protein